VLVEDGFERIACLGIPHYHHGILTGIGGDDDVDGGTVGSGCNFVALVKKKYVSL
jgi:hypothetical protein